ncbi:MAG TPA: peptide deformylase [Methylophaga aminisulfidivorans]|nr:peptide deformylase [Methylophaga aminisulfidivorans]
MTEKFEIHQLGHPVLRQKALPVSDISVPLFQAQLDELMQFVLEKNGMGIAAPQVGISKQFFILSSHPNVRYPLAPNVPAFFVINPEVINHSDSKSKDWEGCLSLPGVRALVPRYDWISVRYQTREGVIIETEYDGFLARVFQHEYDHLIGHVFLDRIDSSFDVMMEHEWQKQFIKS